MPSKYLTDIPFPKYVLDFSLKPVIFWWASLTIGRGQTNERIKELKHFGKDRLHIRNFYIIIT